MREWRDRKRSLEQRRIEERRSIELARRFRLRGVKNAVQLARYREDFGLAGMFLKSGAGGRLEAKMDIKVNIDTDAVVKLTAAVIRQFPYAANNAITRTAKEAVGAGRKELIADLQVRKEFILNRIRILQYSKVSNLTAIIGVDTKVRGTPLILGFLEQSGEKQPTRGSDIAIPLTGEAARPTFPQSVPTSLRYLNLRFQNRKGRKKTFIVPNVGIFQRVASGNSPDATALIYSFKPSARLPQHTHLRDAMIRIIGERFAAIFNEEFTKEILRKAQRVA